MNCNINNNNYEAINKINSNDIYVEEIGQPSQKTIHIQSLLIPPATTPASPSNFDVDMFFNDSDEQNLPTIKTITHEVDAFEKHYQVDEVWNRFVAKRCMGQSCETLNTIRDEAETMVNYAKTNDCYAANIARLKNDLAIKSKRTPISDQIVYGKMFALSLKIANLSTNPAFITGLAFSPKVISKKGIDKQAPASRLFNATPIIYEITDSNNQTQRKLLLIISHLGSGGYNNVSLAYHTNLKKEIALRTLNLNKHPRDLARVEAAWQGEVNIHKSLLEQGIPGLVNLHEVYVLNSPNAPKLKALALERCEGDSYAFITREEDFDKSDRISIFKQRVATLAAMHKINFIHGDYKPGNIFYVYKNAKFQTRLGDFGCSKLADHEFGGGGTPQYKPFDSFFIKSRGDHPAFYAKQSDAWAEGLVAFEIKYGSFQAHYKVTGEIFLFSKNFTKLPQVKKFLALDAATTSTYEARAELFDELIKAFPETGGKLPPFIKKAENTFSTNHFISYMHNIFLVAKFKERHVAIFDKVCQDLLNGKNGYKGSAEDKIIAGLLNPHIKQRLTMEEAQKQLNALV